MARYTFHKKIVTPIVLWLQDSKSVGILLLSCTALSLILANIPSIAADYFSFWQLQIEKNQVHASVGLLTLPNSLLHWINDFLMAIFFLLVGMEIKRELVSGELSSIKKSLLPIFAAIGGMLLPAIIYTQFTKGSPYMPGWSVPMATDIAFTLGIASLLGKRIPLSLKIFITALAIIDDFGAIIVIALFYGSSLSVNYLLLAFLVLIVLYFFNYYKVKFGLIQYLFGILLWYFIFNAGIHATVAGVLFAFMIPIQNLHSLENKLHIPVNFVIMPLFALANTAIMFPTEGIMAINTRYSWGILIGLIIGKPLGIAGFCYFIVTRKMATLPDGVSWYQLIGASILCGIGFTMSIFMSTLAFENLQTQTIAKFAVLSASLIAMLIGYLWFRVRTLNKL